MFNWTFDISKGYRLFMFYLLSFECIRLDKANSPRSMEKGQLPKLTSRSAIHSQKITCKAFQLHNYSWKHTQTNDSATLIPFICSPESSFPLIVDRCRTRLNSSAYRQPLTCCVVLGELGDALDWRTQREMTSENWHKCLSVKYQSTACKSGHFHLIFANFPPS